MLEETAWLVLAPWAFLVFALWFCERSDSAKLSKRIQKKERWKSSLSCFTRLFQTASNVWLAPIHVQKRILTKCSKTDKRQPM